jgi:hypothetical protein
MLCVTIRIGHLVLQLGHQFLDAGGGDRVERRRRLVEQHDLRVSGQRARDAQPLLLPARQIGAQSFRRSLDLFPQRRIAQRLLDLARPSPNAACSPRTRRP